MTDAYGTAADCGPKNMLHVHHVHWDESLEVSAVFSTTSKEIGKMLHRNWEETKKGKEICTHGYSVLMH